MMGAVLPEKVRIAKWSAVTSFSLDLLATGIAGVH